MPRTCCNDVTFHSQYQFVNGNGRQEDNKISVTALSLHKKRNGYQVREIPHQVPTLFKGLLENLIVLLAGLGVN